MVKHKVSSARVINNKPSKNSPQKFWLYTPVQHPGYIAIHRAWYKTGTKELLSVEPQEQPLTDTSRENLIGFLQSVLAGISVVPVIDHATFKKLT